MSEQIDPNDGKGGSYEIQPDGTRILLFRTAATTQPEPAAEPSVDPVEEDGDAKPQARAKQ